MEKINLNEYLAANEYPGRGIAVAKAPDGRQMFIGYFIMGRSENSRNRVFDPVPERGGICTMAADPAKLEDPSLIIYNPVLTLGKTHIVTNGDQTDTIFDEMSRGKSFADALRTRTFEPDEPNYTPRISAVVYADGSYQMSILKSADGNGESVQRYFFDYPQPVAGEGHFISTYKHNGNPIPSFEGEPLRFACPRTIGDFAHGLWQQPEPRQQGQPLRPGHRPGDRRERRHDLQQIRRCVQRPRRPRGAGAAARRAGTAQKARRRGRMRHHRGHKEDAPMNELALKYGCNPNQKPSRIYMEDGSDLPVTVLNGKPGYINFLDALNSIQLVKELKDGLRPARCRFFQARLPGGCRPGPAPDRCGAEDVPHRPGHGAFAAGLRLCPRPRCGPDVLLRRLDRSL